MIEVNLEMFKLIVCAVVSIVILAARLAASGLLPFLRF
jgi:hypothetical protein